jgi:tetratricopeptide (TPR) repeat protein
VEKLKEAISLDAGFQQAQLDLGLTYAELGEYQAALKCFASIPSDYEPQEVALALAYTQAKSGRKEEAARVLAELEQTDDRDDYAYPIAAVYSALGESDHAFDWLRKAFDERSALRTYIKVDPRLTAIRDDERFGAFLAEAGF